MLLGSMKSSIYLGCRYWRLGHCFVEAATEHYFEDAFAVGMTSCKSVVTPGVNDVASNFLREKARLSFEGLLLSIEAGCLRNSMFLTHSASRSNSVVWRLIQFGHVFFCAATVVCKRHRFVFQHLFLSQCSCEVDGALSHDRCVLRLKGKESCLLSSTQRDLFVVPWFPFVLTFLPVWTCITDLGTCWCGGGFSCV